MSGVCWVAVTTCCSNPTKKFWDMTQPEKFTALWPFGKGLLLARGTVVGSKDPVSRVVEAFLAAVSDAIDLIDVCLDVRVLCWQFFLRTRMLTLIAFIYFIDNMVTQTFTTIFPFYLRSCATPCRWPRCMQSVMARQPHWGVVVCARSVVLALCRRWVSATSGASVPRGRRSSPLSSISVASSAIYASGRA